MIEGNNSGEMSPQAEGGFVEETWGDIQALISRHVTVLVCNTMIDEEILLAFFRILSGIWCTLLREKLEICPVWGKLQINFPVRTNETEAIMVLC